jgi:hypothetical protein
MVFVTEDTRMKRRLSVGLLIVVVALIALAFGANTFLAKAQEKPPVTPVGFPPPGGTPSTIPPSTSYQPLTPPPSDPSLPELINNLKELRKQEQHLTKTIKDKILAQKKSLDEAEKELNSLGIDAASGSPLTTPPGTPDKLPGGGPPSPK